jgi:arylformamidase
MEWIDVSFPIRDGMPGFPGDPAVRVEPVRRIAAGSAYNLSSVTLGSHSGTHIDPPRHFLPDGAAIDAIDLGRVNGPVRVIQVPGKSTVIDARAVARVPPGTERVLLRTGNSERWRLATTFFPDYVALDLSGADALLARGVKMVGVDSLSVERDPAERFPVHRRLLSSGALILEGLLLGEVPEGEYRLSCLPLRIADGDGGPCRALVSPIS